MIKTSTLILFLCAILSSSMSFAQYCAANYTNTSDEWITNVEFAGINNASGSAGYEDFTSITGIVAPGATYTANVNGITNSAFGFTEQVGIFIDWDQSGTFEPAETYDLGSQNVTNVATLFTLPITVPAGALPGVTTMRVIIDWNGPIPVGGCISTLYGEAEDYSITVVGSGPPLPIFVSQTPAYICDSGSMTLMAMDTAGNTIHWLDVDTAGGPVYAVGDSAVVNTNVTDTFYFASYDSANMEYSPVLSVIVEVKDLPALSLSADVTTLCENNMPQEIFGLPAGGMWTGTGVVGNTFEPSTSGPGSFVLTYTYTDGFGCTNDADLTMDVQAITADATVDVCEDETATFTGTSNTVWLDATAANPLDTGDTYETMALNASTSFFYADLAPISTFKIDTMDTSGASAVVVDHNTASGDDRTGIAVTPDYIYVVGDGNTVRASAADLTGQISLPRRDGIFSDLRTGSLYTLWDSVSDPVGTFIGSYTVKAIAPMNDMLDIDGASAIPLSQPIVMSGGGTDAGIYAGYGQLILWSPTTFSFYQIEISTGQVTELGIGIPAMNNGENWASWGIAEYMGDELSVVYRGAGVANFIRYNITAGTTETVAEFSNLSDMACFTWSPWSQRYYFHHENSSQFGGTTETMGYIGGTLTFNPDQLYVGCATEIPVNVLPAPAINLGADQLICSNEPLTLDAGTADSYTWSTSETSQTIEVAAQAAYAVTITDASGCTNSDTIDIDVFQISDVNLGDDYTICNTGSLILNAGGGYTSYLWNDGSTNALLSINGFALAPGSYDYFVTAESGPCTATDTVTVQVENCVGINDVANSGFSVYPNPANDVLNIELTSTFSNVSVNIFNAQGALVQQQGIQNSGFNSVNVDQLPAGVYTLSIEHDGGVVNQQISIVR